MHTEQTNQKKGPLGPIPQKRGLCVRGTNTERHCPVLLVRL